MSHTIEIHGGDFNNRGGQLMLWATIRRLRTRQPDVRGAVDAERKAPFASRAAYGLHTLFPSLPRDRPRKTKYIRPVGRVISRLVKPGRLHHYGLVGSNQADAVLDIAGYAYGDKWPVLNTSLSVTRYRDYKRRDRPVVLLPQMLGPFGSPGHRDAFRELASAATRIYARDSISLEASKEALGAEASKLRLAPDLTIEVPPGRLPNGFSDEKPYVVVVPNARMLDKATADWQTRYVGVLEGAIRGLLGEGVRVVVMRHEADRGDGELAERLSSLSGAERLELTDPLQMKAVLAKAQLVISSRFHAVVSSLSSGTPCLTLGWAHKYAALHGDFNVPELFIDEPSTGEELAARALVALEAGNQHNAQERLCAAKARMLPELDRLWEDVYTILRLPAAPCGSDGAA